MSDNPWASSLITSEHLGVSENTLALWREVGYLKYGTHWRYANKSIQSSNENEILYHLNWSQEEMNYFYQIDHLI